MKDRVPNPLLLSLLLFLFVPSQRLERSAVPLEPVILCDAPQSGPYLGLGSPGTVPRLFAPGLVSTCHEHSAAMFVADGMEVWFGRIYPAEILFMRTREGGWSPPQIAPFSGEYPDLYPSLTMDGNRIFFTSQRPRLPGRSLLPRGQGLLWYVERVGSGWSDPTCFDIIDDPRALPACVSAAGNGNLYLCMLDPEARSSSMDIYRIRFLAGRYLPPEKLETISSPLPDHSPFIAPDESYLIWSSFRGGYGLSDLFISHRRSDGRWSEPRNLGPRINSEAKDEYPYVSPDGRFLFFNSNRISTLNTTRVPDGPGNIYWVEARPYIGSNDLIPPIG